jgi:hypothetical protein
VAALSWPTLRQPFLSRSGAGTGSGGAGLTLSAGGTVVNGGSFSGGNGGGFTLPPGAITAGGTGSGGALGYDPTTTQRGVGGAGIIGANLTVTDSGIISGGVANNFGQANAITFTGGSNTLQLQPGYSISGNVVGADADTFQLGGVGSAALNLGLIGATQQYQGFSTFSVMGATWTVTGTYGQTNPWTVQGGTLNVSGDLSAATNLTVDAGTLMGTGKVGTTQINSGGTFAPGSGTPGTSMTVAGNLAFASGTLYVVNLNPITSSFASVNGTATLTGATVNANFAAGSYLSKQYTILATGGLGGTVFTGLTNTNLPAGFTDSLTYSGNSVFLNLTATLGAIGTGGLPQNQQNVANALNNFFNSGAALPPAFVNIFGLTGGALTNALTQLDGEAATGGERAAFQLTNEFLGLMLDPFVNGRGFVGSTGGGGSFSAIGFAPDEQTNLPPDIALAYASILTKTPPQSFEQRWTAWGSAYGGTNNANGVPTVGSTNITASTPMASPAGWTITSPHTWSWASHSPASAPIGGSPMRSAPERATHCRPAPTGHQLVRPGLSRRRTRLLQSLVQSLVHDQPFGARRCVDRELCRPRLRRTARGRLSLRRAAGVRGDALWRRAVSGLPHTGLQRDRHDRRRLRIVLQCDECDRRAHRAWHALRRSNAHLQQAAGSVRPPRLGARLCRQPGAEPGVSGPAGQRLHGQRRADPARLGAHHRRREALPGVKLDVARQVRRRVRTRLADLCRHRHAALHLVNEQRSSDRRAVSRRA